MEEILTVLKVGVETIIGLIPYGLLAIVPSILIARKSIEEWWR